MIRDTIFISHARLPKDDEFVLWLASRLQLLGYKVWCDLKSLKGGEQDYWGRVIDPQIRNYAAKFVLVVTKGGIVRQGVIDEFLFAKAIGEENNLKDFVNPIRIEDVPFTARISLNTYNVINCSDNWQQGLTTLIEKFEEDQIPKVNTSGLSESFKNIVINNYSEIYQKRELYYTSWLRPRSLPPAFYLFQYDTAGQAKSILKNYYKEYPVIRHGNYLVSFHNSINITPKPDLTEINFETFDVVPKEIIEVKIDDIETNMDQIFPTKKDSEYLLKRLFNWSFSYLLTKRGVKTFKMANRKQCFYFQKDYRPGNKVIIHYPNRIKKKNIIGKFIEGFWHFGISFNFQLLPYPSYTVKSHILFSDDGFKIWSNPSKLHSARRKKGRTWFNEQWRDQLMAFLFYLRKEDEIDFITVPVSESFNLQIPCLTEFYYSEFGYDEPLAKDRLDIINNYEEEIEKIDEINEEVR